MSAKNKRKGASFELDVMKWFRSKGVNAERPLSYVVVKRRSAGIEQAWVVQDLQQWLEDKYANT